MDTISISTTDLPVDQVEKLRATLTRASHWSHSISEAPFLEDRLLPAERDIISLSESLRKTKDEIHQAWPYPGFVLEFPEDVRGSEPVKDKQMLLILRDLFHNPVSFSPEQGMVRITV